MQKAEASSKIFVSNFVFIKLEGFAFVLERLLPNMDHLPVPLGASEPPIEIPFVADIPWDFKDFAGFPSRHGYAVSADGNLRLDYISVERLAALLQSWLYFGFLCETMQTEVREDQFRRTRPTHSTKSPAVLLDSSPLPSMLEAWVESRYSYLPKARHYKSTLVPRFEMFLQCLQSLETDGSLAKVLARVNNVEKISARIARHPVGSSKPIPEILFSIQVLCSTFSSVLVLPASAYPASNRTHCMGLLGMIARHMTDIGWCPAIVARAMSEHHVNTLYFMSRVRPPRVPWLSHENCHGFNCIANDVRQDSYVNRHVTSHCSCQLVHVAGKQRDLMIQIIRKGGVPLIQIKEGTSGSVELIVVKHTPNESYLAISHVWSDGLGNPVSNALPFCQIQRLAKVLQGLPRDGRSTNLFWMDTLCIPPANRESSDYSLRLDCIDRMALIYASARRVLVLDHGLEQIRISTSSREELAVHISFCAWNQRTWTLQEGALGRKLLFLFGDGCYPIPSLPSISRPSLIPDTWVARDISMYRKQTTTFLQSILDQERRSWEASNHWSSSEIAPCMLMLRHGIGDELAWTLSKLLQGIDRSGSRRPTSDKVRGAYTFARAWNALRKRTTTMSEDTHIVLANLLGFHPFQISSLRGGDRLKAVMLNLEKIPQSLLYNVGQRDAHTCCSQRWMPTNIHKMELIEDPCMQRTAKGFVISSGLEERDKRQFPGAIILSPPICPSNGPIWLHCSVEEGLTSGPRQFLMRIDLFRFTTHSHYASSLYEESYIVIEDRDRSFCDETTLYTDTVWNAALLHTHKHKPSIKPTKAIFAMPLRLLKMTRYVHSSAHYLASKFWAPFRKTKLQRTETVAPFHASYDCPARITIYPVPLPSGSRRRSRSLQGKHERKLNDAAQDSTNTAVFNHTVWPSQSRHDVKSGSAQIDRIKVPAASFSQDDCLKDDACHIDPAGNLSPLVIDSSCGARYLIDWTLMLETSKCFLYHLIKFRLLTPPPAAETSHDFPLAQRPHPVFVWFQCPLIPCLRLCSTLLPATSIFAIVVWFDETGTDWLWKLALTLHCFHISWNVITLKWHSRPNFCLLGSFHLITSIVCCFFVTGVLVTGSLKVTVLDVYVVIFPFLICAFIMPVFYSTGYFASQMLGYDFWLSSFDRDWRPGTLGWFTPIELRNAVKRLLKNKSSTHP
jgi:hypothetical protein